MSGLTNTGFNVKLFEDIKADIETVIKNRFGSVNLNEESVISQITGVYTEPTAELWLALQAVRSSMSPDTATGNALDGIVQFNGISRLVSTATTVILELTGVNQTLVAAGNEITGTGISGTFRLDRDVNISNNNCVEASILVTSDTFDDYTVNIGGEIITYTKFFGESKEIILDNLISLVNDSDIEISASNINETLYLKSTNNESFSVNIGDGLIFVTATTRGNATCLTKGEIFAPAGSLTVIRTPVFGWLSVNNSQTALVGRNLENDNQLRLRRIASLKRAGSGTVEAIRARLLDLTGVITVSIIENATSSIVDSRPPHSFEVLINGGSDGDIASTIWKTKPAGIETVGNIVVITQDDTGVDKIVKFSRAVSLYIFVRVTVTKADNNTYPPDGDSIIKNDILSKIKSLKIGEPVIYQSFYNSVFQLTGIVSATVVVGSSLNESPTPVLSANNITVSSTQIAVSDLTKIEVIEA